MSTDVHGVLEKYHETLACILGNSFLYGTDEEKGKVSETISEVVNLVIDTKGHVTRSNFSCNLQRNDDE